jgi:UDP-GlcNAc:undecaprenyl-phosphate GlcNAc-1-phosphate transferase
MPSPEMLTAVVILTGLSSALLTFGLIRLNPGLRWSAAPRSDRWHSQATPNSGGVAIFLSCALAYAIAFRGAYSPVAVGGVAIFLLGFLDDRLRLSPVPKLLVQCAIAALVVANGVVFSATSWIWVNWAFSFGWIVGLTNSFNLIDNMDGLCAGVTVVICVFRVFALSASGHVVDAGLAAILAAAFGGFLIFNYRPARIFMGDCGSMLAGFLLSTLTIASSEAHTKAFAAGFFYPALTFAYPIFDTLLVSCLRRAAGRPISVGGRDHSSHRLAYLGIGERRVVWILWALTALGSAIGLLTRWMPLEVIAAAALLVAALAMFGIFLSTLPPYQVPKDSQVLGPWLRKHVPTLRAGTILLVDALLAGVAFFIVFLIRYESNLIQAQVHHMLVSLPVVMLSYGLVSCLGRTYDISWEWFALEDILRIGGAVLAGAVLAGFGMLVLGVNYPLDALLAYWALCFALSAGLRGSLRALHNVFEASGVEPDRVAIFGVSAAAETVAHLLHRHVGLNATPVLFLDYDRSKDGIRIRGIPVRCCDANLRNLAAQFRLKSILIVGPFDETLHADLTRDCLEAGVRPCMLDIAIRDMDATHRLMVPLRVEAD